MNKDNCYRVYKFPIKDSEDNVKLTGGLANEVIYSKYINKELEIYLMNRKNWKIKI